MNNGINVATGEVKAGKNNKVLVSSAIGSCVAVVAIDIKKKVGGIAHVMLPGKFPKEENNTKYAYSAINELLRMMRKLGAVAKNIKVVLAGGASILGLKKNNVGKDNVKAVIELLKDKGIRIQAKTTGGNKRRRVKLDIFNKIVYFTKGNGKSKILWKG